jgi:hypothetical protein
MLAVSATLSMAILMVTSPHATASSQKTANYQRHMPSAAHLNNTPN